MRTTVNPVIRPGRVYESSDGRHLLVMRCTRSEIHVEQMDTRDRSIISPSSAVFTADVTAQYDFRDNGSSDVFIPESTVHPVCIAWSRHPKTLKLRRENPDEWERRHASIHADCMWLITLDPTYRPDVPRLTHRTWNRWHIELASNVAWARIQQIRAAVRTWSTWWRHTRPGDWNF